MRPNRTGELSLLRIGKYSLPSHYNVKYGTKYVTPIYTYRNDWYLDANFGKGKTLTNVKYFGESNAIGIETIEKY